MTQIRFKRKKAKVVDVLEGSPGVVVTRKFLLGKVFGYNEGVKTRTLDVHVSRFPAKLAPKVDVRISSVRGLGYIPERCCMPTEPGPKQNFRGRNDSGVAQGGTEKCRRRMRAYRNRLVHRRELTDEGSWDLIPAQRSL